MNNNDLISRWAAIAQIKENYCHWCDHIDLCQSCETQDCIATIEQQVPAVDAVTVVHARWKSVKAGASNNYPFWDSKCSECGYTTAMTQTGWLYCPHCGAKMDGDT